MLGSTTIGDFDVSKLCKAYRISTTKNIWGMDSHGWPGIGMELPLPDSQIAND
jgi:hypothetical protein